MRMLCRIALAICAVLLITSSASAAQLVYSHEFAQGVTYCPADPQYDDWLSFRASLPASGVQSITVSGSQDAVGRTCSVQATAQQIADAMRSRQKMLLSMEASRTQRQFQLHQMLCLTRP